MPSSARQARVDTGYAVATRRPARSRSSACGASSGTAACSVQRANPSSASVTHLRAGFGDEVRARDPEVDDAVLDVLGHVVGAHEQQVDRRVRARHQERALGRLEPEAGVGAEPQGRLGHPPFRRDGDGEPAVRAGSGEALRRHYRRFRFVRSSAIAVAAGAVAEPLGDPRHGGRARRDAARDLDVRHVLLEQLGGLPPMCERLQLGQRAEVAEEAASLVARPQRQDGVGQIVEPGELLHVAIECAGHDERHVQHANVLAREAVHRLSGARRARRTHRSSLRGTS